MVDACSGLHLLDGPDFDHFIKLTLKKVNRVTLGALEEQTVVCRLNGDYVIGWGILRDWIRWIELGLED